jgi:peptidoglycan/LPS O-acetylase OafA/YrhL
MTRVPALDGLRGISILLVLAVHLFPLKYVFRLDYFAACSGMAIFFCLSGYLIAGLLDEGISAKAFIARRLARVIPLAWLYLAAIFVVSQATGIEMAQNIFFIANIPPKTLIESADHLWSLDIEVQYYFFIAIIWYSLKNKSLPVLLFCYFSLIAYRHIAHGNGESATFDRVDEIVAGTLLYHTLKSPFGHKIRASIRLTPPIWVPTLAFALTCCLYFWPINSLRSACCAWMIGTIILQSDSIARTPYRWLLHPWLKYCASISYALYVIHPLLAHHTWLGSGDLLEKYAKRPLLLLVLFGMAHLSTRFFEPIAMNQARKVA